MIYSKISQKIVVEEGDKLQLCSTCARTAKRERTNNNKPSKSQKSTVYLTDEHHTTYLRRTTVRDLNTIQHKIIILGVTTAYYLSFLNF